MCRTDSKFVNLTCGFGHIIMGHVCRLVCYKPTNQPGPCWRRLNHSTPLNIRGFYFICLGFPLAYKTGNETNWRREQPNLDRFIRLTNSFCLPRNIFVLVNQFISTLQKLRCLVLPEDNTNWSYLTPIGVILTQSVLKITLRSVQVTLTCVKYQHQQC